MRVNRVGVPILSPARPRGKRVKCASRPRGKHDKLFRDYGGRCHYCRRKIIGYGKSPKSQSATIDHKIPKAAGGSSEMSNLVLACRACNLRKADRPYQEFVAEMQAAATKAGVKV